MIKLILDSSNNHHDIICDSCHVKIADCCDFEWKEGQELQYSPILCEKCGREHNDFVGKTVKENMELKEKLEESGSLMVEIAEVLADRDED